MLTEKEVQELRHVVRFRQHYEAGKRYKPVQLEHGPLDGIKTRVASWASYQIGYCKITDNGVVQVIYEL